MKLLSCLLCIATATITQYSTLLFDDGARIATGNRGKYGDSADLLYRDNDGAKADVNGLIFDTKAGGESSGMFFNGNGMTIWNPADYQALHFVDQDEPDRSKWYISQSGAKSVVSDETLKEDIESYDPEDFLQKFKKINLVTYRKKCKTDKCRNKPKARELGIIAQEAEALGIMNLLIENHTTDPDFVDDHESSRYFVDYEKLNVVLLKAVQKMTVELENKTELVKQLEENNVKIENALKKL